MCTAPARCCSQRLQGGQGCLERTHLTLIERDDYCVVFLCWLRLEFVPVFFVLLLFQVLRVPCACFSSLHSLSAPLSTVTAKANCVRP
jgi:hypothetical protein